MEPSADDTSSLGRAQERLYRATGTPHDFRVMGTSSRPASLQHTWADTAMKRGAHQGKRHIRLATAFFKGAFLFFLVALAVVSYFFYFGGNTVSVDKITTTIQGPTTIAGGDIVPLSLTITNRNPSALTNATIEVVFPSGTRDAQNVQQAYPRYLENLGTIESGATVTRSLKATVFGGAGQTLSIPISLSYGTSGSNSVFVKKSSYDLAVSSTPLSVSVENISETVSGKPLTFTLTVRSNAKVALQNVVLVGTLPFGFSTVSSSLPFNNSSFLLGNIAPGASKKVTLTGTLLGQDKEQRVFHFAVGTANSSTEQAPAVEYMTQDATVTIVAPFINTTLAINGDTRAESVVMAGTNQNVTVSYTNTLQTNITNAVIAIRLSGTAINYDSIQAQNGFYQSADRTIIFSRDTDPSLGSLAPGASGNGSFTFSTLSADTLGSAPTITFTMSVSGTRVGQTNVLEEVNSSVTKTAKVVTTVALSSSALRTTGGLSNTGPIPPRANQITTYAIALNAKNKGSAIAGGIVKTTLPDYVTYTGLTTGIGTFSYDEASRVVSWNVGDIAQNASKQGVFQVALTPSVSQKGSAPALTGPVSFVGHDRFAGVQVVANADPVTTETKTEPGYSPSASIVQ